METFTSQILAVVGIIFLSTFTYMFINKTYKNLKKDSDVGGRFIWVGAVGLSLFSIIGLFIILIK